MHAAYRKIPILFFTLTVLSLCVASAQDAADGELIVNGGFEVDATGDGIPDGWDKRPNMSTGGEEGNRWLVLSGSYAASAQKVALKQEWTELTLTMRMRVTDVEKGKEGWHDARLAMSFVGADGQRVGDWPNVFHAAGSTDWVVCNRVYPVPLGAAALQLNPANFGTQGKVEFDDISLRVTATASFEDLALPEGADDPWAPSAAWRQTSSTRERICINGLWRFMPAGSVERPPEPGSGWGWFKVPSIWPVKSWDMDEPAQAMQLPSGLASRADPYTIDRAWHQREINIPADWKGRRITLDFGMVQTHARVLIDKREAGEIWFPGGSVDITEYVTAGSKHTLSVLLTARPLEAESKVFMAPDRIISSKATVKLKGLTGDVYLESEPVDVAIKDVHVITSVRNRAITFDVGVRGEQAGTWSLSAVVKAGDAVVKRFPPDAFTRTDAGEGRVSATAPWADPKLWDTDTPGNMYEAVVTLKSGNGTTLDESLPVQFGFREFWIEGRDFMLNGSPIHLRALHNRNMNDHADKACIEGSRRACERMLEYGFNFFITGNYNFSPGAVGYMDALLTAADETGMLASFSLPHGKDFQWKLDDPVQAKRYRDLSEWLIRRAQNHPSVVSYSMNHNATGYYGDQNPLKIDGIYDPDKLWPSVSRRRVTRQQCTRAADIARSLDPTRAIYHHQSGNLGDMHTVNIYLNWAPRQERSDWLEHWSTKGEKPVFFVEWGLPHVSSWSSYRGPEFIWRCDAYQQIWDSEFAAAVVGDGAYKMTKAKEASFKHEEDLWSRGPFAWGYAIQPWRGSEETYLRIQSWFADDNWRAHRTWGVSAMLPWDQGGLLRRLSKTDGLPREDAFRDLQRPGIVPDSMGSGSEYFYDSGPATKFEPTSLGRAFLRWNTPLIAYIGGGPDRFTDKGHNYLQGQTIEKQIVAVNDTRRDRTCRFSWTLGSGLAKGEGSLKLTPGATAFAPIKMALPAELKPGPYTLSARCVFDTGETQDDAFDINVLAAPAKPALQAKIGLWDPEGQTAKLLRDLGVGFTLIDDVTRTTDIDILVIGREALSGMRKAPSVEGVRDGQRVLVFEQSTATLTSRLGFRIAERGMRIAFPRTPSHAALVGMGEGHLRDWQGAATLIAPHLDLPGIEDTNPTWNWCGFVNTRVWRCGNQGTVASVVIEKPTRGNWLPILDCGFDLQYSPLLECVEGKGRMVFCQLDVTGRTQRDPAADRIVRNLLAYLAEVKPAESRQVVYRGDDEVLQLLTAIGTSPVPALAAPDAPRIVVVGPGARTTDYVRSFPKDTPFLALGLDAGGVKELSQGAVSAKRRKGACTVLDAGRDMPELTGISNADLYRRTLKLEFDALADGTIGNDMLGVANGSGAPKVFCQVAPWMLDVETFPYLRKSQRRNTFLVSRLLGNLGASFKTSLLETFSATPAAHECILPASWVGKVDRDNVGRNEKWWTPELDETGWQPIEVPGMFDEQIEALADYEGLFWYRLRFQTPANLSESDLKLYLGAIDDESWVWLNGRFIGEVTKETRPKDYWAFLREYPLKRSDLEQGGVNVLVVLVNDMYLSGGIRGIPSLFARPPWLDSYYVQDPQSGDDPYRYYRW